MKLWRMTYLVAIEIIVVANNGTNSTSQEFPDFATNYEKNFDEMIVLMEFSD